MEDVTKFTGEFAESVTVVTVVREGKANAMTAAWVVPVSHRPPPLPKWLSAFWRKPVKSW